MSRLALSGRKKYYPEKMTELQKDKLKESNLKLWTFMFGEKTPRIIVVDNVDLSNQNEVIR